MQETSNTTRHAKHSPKLWKRPMKCYSTFFRIFFIFILNYIFCKSGQYEAVLISLPKTISLHLQQVRSSSEKQIVTYSREVSLSVSTVQLLSTQFLFHLATFIYFSFGSLNYSVLLLLRTPLKGLLLGV